jgi:hypothetical protein
MNRVVDANELFSFLTDRDSSQGEQADAGRDSVSVLLRRLSDP